MKLANASMTTSYRKLRAWLLIHALESDEPCYKSRPHDRLYIVRESSKYDLISRLVSSYSMEYMILVSAIITNYQLCISHVMWLMYSNLFAFKKISLVTIPVTIRRTLPIITCNWILLIPLIGSGYMLLRQWHVTYQIAIRVLGGGMF